MRYHLITCKEGRPNQKKMVKTDRQNVLEVACSRTRIWVIGLSWRRVSRGRSCAASGASSSGRSTTKPGTARPSSAAHIGRPNNPTSRLVRSRTKTPRKHGFRKTIQKASRSTRSLSEARPREKPITRANPTQAILFRIGRSICF